MVGLIEILGRGIEVPVAELIWKWLRDRKAPGACGGKSQQDRLERVLGLVEHADFSGATRELRLYLLDNPSCPMARLAAAAIGLQDSLLNEAIEQLNSVYVQRPSNTLALYALGHCHERLGQEAQAIEFYQDCLKFAGYLKPPAQRLAAIYFKNGRLDRAIEQYELLAEHYPDDDAVLVTLGQLYISRSDHLAAMVAFNKAILNHPDSLLGMDEAVRRLMDEGMFYEALDRLRQMLETQPENLELLLQYADVLALTGARAEAVSEYQQALRLCPESLEATIKLGTQYLKMDCGVLAAQQFNLAAEINDRIVDAYIGLATAQQLAGSPEEALSTVSLAAAIQPNTCLLFAETAGLLFGQAAGVGDNASRQPRHSEDYGAIIEAHARCIRQRPNDPKPRYHLGVLWMHLARFGEALSCFETVLSINPIHPRTQAKRLICLFEGGNYDAVLAELSKTSTPDAQTLALHYKTALLYCDRVRFASSMLNLQRHVANTCTACTDTTANISLILENLGLTDKVWVTWDSLVSMAGHGSANRAG